MSKKSWKNNEHYFSEIFALESQDIQDCQFKFQGRSPKFKDFSRLNSFSMSFQGKPEIQGCVTAQCGVVS